MAEKYSGKEIYEKNQSYPWTNAIKNANEIKHIEDKNFSLYPTTILDLSFGRIYVALDDDQAKSSEIRERYNLFNTSTSGLLI